ncbi:hypothetical protein [Actinopolymorpha pittospori]|jgi:hypothetical protein|uniref:Uncharacterized protein n=1 Tax=Actinopolymorpha pittospori TaxID=648752 RepID=A0A927NBX8_9ACTN|nr:hypothetical protein [Actinopolymorpha pittospori]MBE1612702.1 hypothetical protein [Actinopolymorpha pittospori]
MSPGPPRHRAGPAPLATDVGSTAGYVAGIFVVFLAARAGITFLRGGFDAPVSTRGMLDWVSVAGPAAAGTFVVALALTLLLRRTRARLWSARDRALLATAVVALPLLALGIPTLLLAPVR